MTVTLGNDPRSGTWSDETRVVRGSGLRVPPTRARAALTAVLGLPADAAVDRLRRGAVACEPIARLLEGAAGPGLVVAAAAVGPGADIVRVRRKAHGKADWITTHTSDLTVELGPVAREDQVGELAGPAADTTVVGIWERPLPEESAAVLDRLYDVLDPDLGINVVDFGFVRDLTVTDDGVAVLTMTLTSPACPLTGVMLDQIRTALAGEDPVVADVRVDWVWTPAWRPRDLSPDGVEQLRAIGFSVDGLR